MANCQTLKANLFLMNFPVAPDFKAPVTTDLNSSFVTSPPPMSSTKSLTTLSMSTSFMFSTDPSGPSNKRSAVLMTLLPLAGIHSPSRPSSNNTIPLLSLITGASSKSLASLSVAYLLTTLPIP